MQRAVVLVLACAWMGFGLKVPATNENIEDSPSQEQLQKLALLLLASHPEAGYQVPGAGLGAAQSKTSATTASRMNTPTMRGWRDEYWNMNDRTKYKEGLKTEKLAFDNDLSAQEGDANEKIMQWTIGTVVLVVVPIFVAIITN
mmetsp:Transcript_89388/g.154762  ORF Transcript_89388/g.154762 Transcript_89388/m.154762 type:complete len:144 (+) Transcript_89388:71-502(+)